MHLVDLDDDGIDFTRPMGVLRQLTRKFLRSERCCIRCGFRSVVLGST
jgi:hypothetical protein